jgi:hypothetical protein
MFVPKSVTNSNQVMLINTTPGMNFVSMLIIIIAYYSQWYDQYSNFNRYHWSKLRPGEREVQQLRKESQNAQIEFTFYGNPAVL